MTLGERLRWAIGVRGYSVRRFHKLLQGDGLPRTSYAAVQRYVSDETRPPPEFVAGASQVLRLRLDWLLSESGAALEEDWAREQKKEQQGAVLALIGRVQDPMGDGAFIASLDLGDEPLRWHRYKAVRRFAHRLYDADASQSAWAMESDRHAILAAALRFLIGVEKAFVAAGTDDKSGTGRYPGQTFRHDLLLQSSSSGGWNVTWSDAVLDLFARRVIGLGERDAEYHWDSHSPAASRAPDLSF